MTKNEALRKYFGHNFFREGQDELIDCVLSGRDCLGVMPTGAGKSLCYQVPALMMKGTCVVISPLISLMRDQVNALLENGISAACINSSMSEKQSYEAFRMAENGELKILYVAPERLETESFSRLCERLFVPLVAVDEAHCVSHWGQDFRPSYLKIAGFVNSLKERPVIAAFTATATDIVKRDIIDILGLSEPFCVTTGFDRPNLYFEVRKPEYKERELLDIIRETAGSAIVYCATRKNVESVSAFLREHGINAAMYHAGLSAEARRAAQDDFIRDKIDVMVATNAFGMGIDKSNVSLVAHFNMPKDLESYYQEAGRAGRDGSPARCILLYSDGDVELARFMIDAAHDNDDLSLDEQKALKERDYKRLRKMTNYCATGKCLRAFILGYFGEKAPMSCANCGNCLKDYDTEDVTLEAQKILSCIFRLKQRGKTAGKTTVCRILLGSRDKKILEGGLDTLSTYGIMKGYPRAKLRGIVDFLESEGLIEICGEFNICVLTPKADEFIRNKGTVMMRVRSGEQKLPEKTKTAANGEESGLFSRLRAVRRRLAEALGVPPYVVFSDKTLWDMCVKLPKDHDELLDVSGVGERKAERYGKAFLGEIVEYLAENKQTD